MVLKVLHWLCRLALAAVFIYSGYIKVRAPLQFAVAITGYKLVPENLIFPMAQYLPWIEIGLGVAILIGWKIRYFSAGAAALLLFFMAILTITYFRGIEASCGCFGLDDPISLKTIARDSSFLIPALYLAVENKIRKRIKGAVLPSSRSILDAK
jgi:uncharacterized membrane protein YphA (DoxX/SURF4 family)